MEKHSKNPPETAVDKQEWPTRAVILAAAAFAAVLASTPAQAQRYPVTSGQRSTAEQVAQAGVPLSELAPNAPEDYTVKRGDTLWAISGLFLRSAWRWPELWGMNMQEVRNPHLIFPGQHLVLEKEGGMARLRVAGRAGSGEPTDVVRVSPRVRIEPLPDTSIPTLQSNLIEPFLNEPLIIDEQVLSNAPRIVAAPENRVMITRGDRAYARGLAATPLVQRQAGRSDDYRVFRNAKPLRDPVTKALLGYEAEYLGKALLVRGESIQPVQATGGSSKPTIVPGTIDIISAKEEMRVGDRLLPEPPRQFQSYVPHAPLTVPDGSIVSVYGDAVSFAGQKQIVVINKGTADGVEPGHVFAILKDGRLVNDTTQSGERAAIKLPDERNGLLMVFRPFEKLSYALILEITDAVKIGDRVTSPR